MKKVLSFLTSTTLLTSFILSASPVHAENNVASHSNAKNSFANQQTNAFSQPTVHIPPAGFDYLHASAQELNYYNIPPRPTDVKQLEDWKKHVMGVKFTKPKFKLGNHHANPIRNSSTLPSPSKVPWITMDNWGGFEDFNYNYPIYNRVVSEWQIPYVDSVPDPYNNNLCVADQWIGLGGDGKHAQTASNPPPLIQEGTDETLQSDGYVSYTAWYEIYGSSQQTNIFLTDKPTSVAFDLSVIPDDLMYGDVWFTVDYPGGPGTAHFYILNETTNIANSFEQDNIYNYWGVNSSAEWISERPGSGLGVNLAKYGTFDFWGARAGDINSLQYANMNDPALTYIQTTYNGKAIQYGGQLDSNNPYGIDEGEITNTGDFQMMWKDFNF